MYFIRLIISLSALALSSAACLGQTTLTISINDIEQAGKGQLIALIYDKDEGFPREHDKAARRVTTRDFSSSAEITFSDVLPGDYAVIVYQDLNGNGEMDSNFIGFPKEPLGLTKMTSLGRPTFKKSTITVGSASLSINLKLLNQ